MILGIAGQSSFNSTLVRFKALRICPLKVGATLSQFHIGSIQRSLWSSNLDSFSWVSIPHWFDSKSQALLHRLRRYGCFNSTLVRFKAGCFSIARVIVLVSIPHWFDSKRIDASTGRVLYYWFQFHIGSIQRRRHHQRLPCDSGFQFHIGSIQS